MLLPPVLLAPPAPAVALRFRPPLGARARAQIVNRMSRVFPGQPNATFVQTFTLATTALSRKAGATTLQTKADDVKVDGPAGSGLEKARAEILKATNGKVSTIVVDAYGVPRSAVAPGIASTSSLGGFNGVVYPAKPVRIGESWTYRMDAARLAPGANGSSVSGHIPIRYTLKALSPATNLSPAGGKRTAVLAAHIDGRLKLNAQGMATPLTVKGTGEMTVDVATGTVLKSRMSMETVVPMGSLGAMRQRVEIEMKVF